MTHKINLTSHNTLWMHCKDSIEFLPTICVDNIRWFKNGKSELILKGFFLEDRFLLDVWQTKDLVAFEVLTSACGDKGDYKQGKRLLIANNPRPRGWWTDDIMSLEQVNATHLYCRFVCDWIEICEL